MKKITTYQNKKVLVLGLARSGFSAAKLLHDLGALVTVNDGKPFAENPEAQDLLALGVKVITGSHPIELLDEGFSLVVKNPGIPYSQPLVQKALEKKIPVITEVELAYQISEAPIKRSLGAPCGGYNEILPVRLLLKGSHRLLDRCLSGSFLLRYPLVVRTYSPFSSHLSKVVRTSKIPRNRFRVNCCYGFFLKKT